MDRYHAYRFTDTTFIITRLQIPEREKKSIETHDHSPTTRIQRVGC